MEKIDKQVKESNRLTGDDLRLLFSSILGDIEATKKKQVETTNYIALILVAIVSVWRLLPVDRKGGNFINFCFDLLSLLIVLIGITYISRLEKDLERSREQKNRVIKLFPNDIYYILYGTDKGIPSEDRQPQSIVWIYYLLLSIGLVVVVIFTLI